MAQDSLAFRPYDPSRINALDPAELRYWSAELGCTEHRLSDAIATVGDHVTVVRQFLKSGANARTSRQRRNDPRR